MLLYLKYILRCLILNIIHVLTDKKSSYCTPKFVSETHIMDDIYIKTPTGYSRIKKIFKTRDFEHCFLNNGVNDVVLECADTHQVILVTGERKFIRDLEATDVIQAVNNKPVTISSLTYSGFRNEMYDIELDDEEHVYYTDNILSHNTTTTAIFFTHYTIFNTDKCAAIAAQRDQIASEIFSKVKNIIRYMPFFLKPGCLKFNNTSYSFDNGCSALFRPATIDCLQGYTIDLLFVDEFAYIKNTKAREFWNNVYPTLSAMASSRVIICSTPNGRNLFHELWTNSIEGKNYFTHKRIDYWEVPGRDAEWVEKEVANLGSKAAFDQQYGLSFDTSVITALTPEIFHYLNKICRDFEKDLFNMRTDYNEFFRWSTQWKYSFKNDWFLISVDVGEGLSQDYSVIKFRKLFLNEDGVIIMPTIGVFECNTIIIEDFAKVILFSLSRFDHGKIKLVIERNTYGDLLMKNIDSLVEKIPSVDLDFEVYAKFRRSVDNKKLEKGIRLNAANKKAGVGNWKKLIEDKQFIETDKRTVDQYREFGDDGKGNFKASIGHDDLVMPDVNAAYYIKSNNTGWNEFIEEFRENATVDKFNCGVMEELSLIAIGESKKESTYESDEYGDLDDYASYSEIKEQKNEYDALDDYTEEDDEPEMGVMIDELEMNRYRSKDKYVNLSREERNLAIARDLV